mgnify:CR=1 FL=1
MDIFVARQPIYDRRLNVAGYELLYRSGSRVNASGPIEGEQATSQVLVNTFMEFGLDAIVGDKPAFVNFTQGALENGVVAGLPADALVLEVLEDVTVTPGLVQALKELKAKGFRVALDDFVYQPELQPLVDLAEIIKIDVMGLEPHELTERLGHLMDGNFKLLAEKVEDKAMYDLCLDLGFDYFQGYFLSKPDIVEGRRLPANRTAILRLLACLYDPEVEIGQIERLVSQDVSLSYRLLRYINSPYFALAKEVTSIQRAVTLIGLKEVKTWVTLLALSGIDDKPDELVTRAMVRARMCEQLARERGIADPDSCFTLGLFSMLDVLLDIPLAQILDNMPLTAELREALLNHAGPKGGLLNCVLDYEKANWEALPGDIMDCRHAPDAYLGAVKWADETLHGLAET